MRRLAGLLTTLAIAAGGLMPLPALAEDIPVDVKADSITYERGPEIATLKGHVEVKVKGATVTGDELIFDQKKQTLVSETNFRLVQKDDKGRDQVIEGTSFVYTVDIRRAEVIGARATLPATTPDSYIYVTADQMTSFDQGARLVGQGAMVTTCDYVAESAGGSGTGMVHYSIVAGIIDYIPDDRIVGWGATINVMTAPVYWLPLIYLPLQKIKIPTADIGQNLVEGVFIRGRQPVPINDEHEGTIFAEVMQNKGLGVGYQHDWGFPGFAVPSDAKAGAVPFLSVLGQPSHTYLFVHGIPLRGLTLFPFGLDTRTAAGTTSQTLQTQQIPGVPAINTQPLAQPDPSQRSALFATGPVSWFEDYDFGFQHRRLLWPTAEAEISLYDRNYYNLSQFLGGRDNDRSIRLNFSDKEAWQTGDEVLNLDTSGSLDDATRWDQTKSKRELIPQGTASTRSMNLTMRRGATSLSSQNSWNISQAPGQPAAGTTFVPGVQQPLVKQNDSLSSNWTFEHTLLPGLQWSNQFNYQQKELPNSPTDRFADINVGLTQALGWGSTSLRLFRKQFFNVGLTDADVVKLGQQRGTIFEKLPEFEVRSNNILDNIFPFTVTSTIGNYVETIPSAPNPVQAAKARFDIKTSQRPLDLGLGFKSDFGGTGIEQSLYSTADAQFSFTGKAALTNDASQYFRPTLTYTKVVTGDTDPLPYKNNTPFSQDKTSFNKVDQISAQFAAINQPWLTMTFTGGYDFQNKGNMPVNANLTSVGYGIGDLVDYNLTLQSGYQFRNFTEAEVTAGQPVKALNGIDTITADASDVGRFLNFKGGQFSGTVLGLQVQTMGGFGGDWGKESAIKQGGSIRLDTSWDINKNRPQALASEISFSIGDTWAWHTEVALQSTLDLSGNTSTAAAGLLPIPWPGDDPSKPLGIFYPLNRIVLKKDLHDFIFSLSYDRFTQGFQANLSLVAFPFGSDNLSGAFNQLSSGTLPQMPMR
ncbi:MAG: LPS-assembly protein LptD [Candidatus Sericytochromatia bacterium]|nr:LPS-assembly protein LptD [Candidatus Sericytochromatia bacterium]